MLRRALDFIHDNAEYDITHPRYRGCGRRDAAGDPVRVSEHLDTTPLEYLRRVRLERAHQELRLADPSQDTVTSIARPVRVQPSRPVQQRLQGSVRHRNRVVRCAAGGAARLAAGRSRPSALVRNAGLPTLSAEAQHRPAVGMPAQPLAVWGTVCRCPGLRTARRPRLPEPGVHGRPLVGDPPALQRFATGAAAEREEFHVGAGPGEMGVVHHSGHVGGVAPRLVGIVRSSGCGDGAELTAAAAIAEAKSSRIMSHP